PCAAVIDNQKGYYTKLHVKDLDAKDLKTLDEIRFATFAIELGDGKPVRLALDAKSAAAVPVLLKSFDGYARMALDMLHDDSAAAAKANETESETDKLMKKLTTELVHSRQVHTHGSHVE